MIYTKKNDFGWREGGKEKRKIFYNQSCDLKDWGNSHRCSNGYYTHIIEFMRHNSWLSTHSKHSKHSFYSLKTQNCIFQELS